MDEKYLGIQIFRFSIKCTRCSAEIVFRTDPKIAEYTMVKGAVRNMEPWRNKAQEEESVDERLDRLEREEAEAVEEEEKNVMAELEAKNFDTQREMAAADALEKIRQRNARLNRSEKEGVDFSDAVVRSEDEEQERQEREDEEAAKRAFAAARQGASARSESVDEESSEANSGSGSDFHSDVGTTASSEISKATEAQLMPPPSFKRVVKKRKDHSALLGIKKKPSLV